MRELLKIFHEKTIYISKTKKAESTDQRFLMLCGAIQSDGQKMLPKCPNNLNRKSHFNILKHYDEQMHISGFMFQQDNAPVHPASSTKIFIEKLWEEFNLPPDRPHLNNIKNFRAIVEIRFSDQTVS